MAGASAGAVAEARCVWLPGGVRSFTEVEPRGRRHPSRLGPPVTIITVSVTDQVVTYAGDGVPEGEHGSSG